MSLPESAGYIVGSISESSINRKLALALETLSPEVGLKLYEIPIRDLPIYNRDHGDSDDGLPPSAAAFRREIRSANGILFVTPEYNRSVPGVLKNAVDWASRPKTSAPLGRKPAYVVGASTGAIGTALAQQHLRSSLAFFDAPVLGQPEVYLQMKPGLIDDNGSVTDDSTRQFLPSALESFRDHLALHRTASADR